MSRPPRRDVIQTAYDPVTPHNVSAGLFRSRSASVSLRQAARTLSGASRNVGTPASGRCIHLRLDVHRLPGSVRNRNSNIPDPAIGR